MLSYDDYLKEDEAIKNLFDHINTTVIFISQALSQFEAYSFLKLSDEELLELKNEIFSFHVKSFQFFIVVNFCKLLEPIYNDQRGVASLVKLNSALSKKYRTQFTSHSDNVKIIKEIRSKRIFKIIYELRNMSYAHSDVHPLNKPRTMILMNESDTKEFREIFLQAITVLKNCYGFYDVGSTFHHFYDSSSPANFLKQYLKMKKFWKEDRESR